MTWPHHEPADDDYDGDLEIVNVGGDGRLYLIDHQGVPVWKTENPVAANQTSGAPALANFDISGDAEIGYGRAVYASDGSLAWVGNGGHGTNDAYATLSCVADLSGDLRPELIGGGTAYTFTGTVGVDFTGSVLWQSGADGYCGVADFQLDGEAVTKDGSSNRTGSSVFDFDGDGHNEVVYGDEYYLRIYPGIEPDCELDPVGPNCDQNMTDEDILFIDITSSGTRVEYPVIADVDGDFKAEIVVSTNNNFPQGDIGDAGIEVFEDRLDNWVGTLPIWNQHSYHITNVNAKGEVPVVEDDNWKVPAGKPYNSYRRNIQGAVENCAPDLVPQDLESVGSEELCPNIG